MGCATSKQRRCPDCLARVPYTTPIRRSSSMHAPDRRRRSVDSAASAGYHVVALRSSTMGSLDLDSTTRPLILKGVGGGDRGDNVVESEFESEGVGNKIGKSGVGSRREDFSMGVMEAKTWSNMIEEKIPRVGPRTPTRTPPGEPETINAWELMEGLEDGVTPPRRRHKRGFSFDVFPAAQFPAKRPENDLASPKPFWHQLEAEEDAKADPNSRSLVSYFDPDIISAFKKAMQELSPPGHSYKESHRKTVQIHSAAAAAAVAMRGDATPYKFSPPSPYRKDDKAVLYFTSLRGVRKTYEDCCSVRTILKGTGVRIDERDVSMHSGFKEELKELLGGGVVDFPRVFVGGRLIGGAEEVRRLHEEGKLEKALEGCQAAVGGSCDACGDVRFVPCDVCFGSCKVCYELDDEEGGDDDDDEGSIEEFGFRRCPDCNENGLRRCPFCCD